MAPRGNNNNNSSSSSSSPSTTVDLDPLIIHFTHSKIRRQFSGCNKLLDDTLRELMDGTTSIAQIPRIRVLYDAPTQRYFSMNNRRLWVFKELRRAGRLQTVAVEMRAARSGSERRLATGTLSLEARACLQ